MGDFVALTCPSCGGKLQVTPDIDLFACAYCGNELKVKRGAGIVALAPVAEKLDKVRVGVDKTASELAIARLRSDLLTLETEIRKATDWFRRLYPDNQLLQGSVNIDVFVRIIEDDVNSRKTALSRDKAGFRLFTDQKAKAAKQRDVEALESAVAKLSSLVTTLREKQSQLRRHEQIVNQ